MLELTVVMAENYDEDAERFITDEVVLVLEHSLVSLSKWESKWEKPFLSEEPKTTEETLSYIECMILNPEFPPEVISALTPAHIDTVDNYINAKMTATWFGPSKEKPGREIVTAEVMYYWLTAMEINWEAQHWHLNRLMTLVRVINDKNAPPKKRAPGDLAEERRRENARRQKLFNTTG